MRSRCKSLLLFFLNLNALYVMINEKMSLVLAKARNLCYYCSIDTRPRSTYIHVVRELREEMKSLLSELPKDGPEFNFFLGIIRSCPQQIKADQCRDFIMNVLRPYFYGQ